MAKAGRKKAVIDAETFEGLCKIQCTKIEICDILGVSDKTIDKWCREYYKRDYSDVYRQKSAGGKMSIRRRQFEMAKDSAAMAIWLGKQYLGQMEPVTEKEKAQTELLKAQTEILKAGKGQDVVKVQIIEDLENDG